MNKGIVQISVIAGTVGVEEWKTLKAVSSRCSPGFQVIGFKRAKEELRSAPPFPMPLTGRHGECRPRREDCRGGGAVAGGDEALLL